MSLESTPTSPAHADMTPLFDTPQWIVVRLVPLPNGKTDKLPVDWRTGNVTEKGSDGAHKPAIWTTYEQARNLAEKWGSQFTVGFVLTATDLFFCLDIDNALQPDGTWSPLSQQLCSELPGCVIEVSQSGRGLHVWGWSATPIPPHRKKRVDLGIEFYTERRFIAIGHSAVGDMSWPCLTAADFAQRYFPESEASRRDLPDEGPRADWRGPTDDEELLRRAMQSRSAASTFGADRATFADLYERNVDVLARAYPPDSSSSEPFDASSADAALFAHLAFWTGCDVARMERIARTSKLVREKWDSREDYLPRTIANARGQQREVLQDREPSPPTLTVDEAIDRLRSLKTPSEVAAAWLALTVPLSPTDRERVVEYVSALTVVGRQALKRELREADQRAKLDRQAKALTARAGERVLVDYRPEASSIAAAEIEAAIVARAAPGEFVSFAGALSHVTTKPLPYTHLIDTPEEAPPDVPQIEPLDSVAILQRVEAVAVLCETRRDGSRAAIAVPDRMIEILLKKKRHAALTVTGLLTHPIVVRDGSILAADGLHEPTGLFLSGAQVPNVRPYTQHEAVAAIARLRGSFLDGFEFASALDADAAIAGLLTGVQRRVLDGAPGLAILASMQSSGKTTLARRVHLILTGRDMPVSTFPLGDEAEAAKRLLSALLRSPAMIAFDNVQDGFTFASGSLAAAMTSSTIEQRLLGVSRDVTAPTTVLFVLTGNNLTLGNDEVTRWLVSRLAPTGARPHERRFRHPDVVAHALNMRADVLRDVIGTVAGYAASGAKAASTGTRFPTWDRMVRQPLLWAGASDVAEVFRTNAEQSEPVRALRSLLWSLQRLFGSRWFKAAEVATAACAPGEPNGALRFALEALAVRSVEKARSVSRALQANLGRVAEVGGCDVQLEKTEDSHSGIDAYRVAATAGFRGV